jgi:transcriptional regulator with XRE-family HTH domain
LVNFGEFVKSARERLASSQEQAKEILAKAGLTVSQSWVAMLETGRISDPDVSTLVKLAKAYDIDLDQLVYALIRDKYKLDDLSVVSLVSRERWRVCAELLRHFPAVGGVEGLEADQLRAKREMLQAEILDLPGLARWQREFRRLKELWIVAPHFQDDKDPALREAVIHNLGRGVRSFYFIRKTDLDEGRPFWLFLRRLAQDYPALKNRLQKQIHGVGLEEAELRWLMTDLMIANPTEPASRTGFVGLRQDHAMKFACRMSTIDAEAAVHGIMPFLAKRSRKKVL